MGRSNVPIQRDGGCMDERDEQDEPQRRPRPANEGVRIIGAEEAAAALEKGQAGPEAAADLPAPGPESEPAEGAGSAAAGDRITFETDSAELPHWTDPPTGEIPRALVNEDTEAADEAWANRGPRWRDSGDDW